MEIRSHKELAKYLEGKKERDRILILANWGMDIVEECAQVAESWKSVTPEFTSDYIRTVKKYI